MKRIDALYSLITNIGVKNIFWKKHMQCLLLSIRKDEQLVMNHFLRADRFSERCTLDISQETH